MKRAAALKHVSELKEESSEDEAWRAPKGTLKISLYNYISMDVMVLRMGT
jgi:hypothetical protein